MSNLSPLNTDKESLVEVERELEDIEKKMSELERDREDRSRRIMDKRVMQVTTLQELGEYYVLFIQYC